MSPETHDPKQKPMKKNDHFIDCLRYIMNSNPVYHNLNEDVGEVEYEGTFAKYPKSTSTSGYRDLTEKARHYA
jgi:hypothetical protein